MATTLSRGSEENQLVNFKLGSEEYGIDIVKVREIIKVPNITRVPWAPDFVEGVINLRGTILPVIDTRKRFNLEPFEKKDTTRIVVASIDGAMMGLIVDSVSEVLRIDSEDVEPPPPIINTGNNADYLVGIGKLLGGKRLISLLDINSIFQSDCLDEQLAGMTRHKSRLGEKRSSDVQMDKEVQLVSFQLGSEEYALDINLVEEIIRIPEIKKIPDVPHFVKGIVSLRGKVLPIICLRLRFGMEEKVIDNRSRILVVRSGVVQDDDTKFVTFGLVVDLVNEVLALPVSAIDPPPSILWEDTSYIRGVGKLQGGKRLILLLDVAALTEQFGSNTFTDPRASLKELPGYEGEKKRMVNERQLVNFKIGREEFGIDIMKVQEIIRMTEITEIPGSPYYVEGVVNLRGEVLPVLDLRKRFGLEEKEKCDTNRIVVVNENKTITGIIVDSVSEVLQLHERDVEPPPRIVSGVDGDFIEGIGKLNGGERFIIMLDLRSVLNVRSGEKDFSADNADVAIESEPEAEPEPVIEEHTLEMPIPGQGIETAEFEEVLVDAGSVEKSGIGGRTRKSKKAKA